MVVSFPGLRSRLRGAGHSTLRGTSTAESVRWGFVLRHPPHILGDVGACVLCLAARGVSVKVAVFGAVRRRYVTSIIAPWVACPYLVQAVESKRCPLLSVERTNHLRTACVIPFSIHPARDIVRRVNLVPCKFNPPAAVRYVYGPMNVCVISVHGVSCRHRDLLRLMRGSNPHRPHGASRVEHSHDFAALPTELRSRVCVQASKLRDTVFFVRLYAVGRMKASTMEKSHKSS